MERYNALKRTESKRRELSPAPVQKDEALTASGMRVRHGTATYLRRLIMPWQIRAFGYYDLLGEIKSAAQFYSRSLANLELYAAEIDDDGDIVKTDNEEVIAALDRIKDPGGVGRSGLLASYGRLRFLVGEALLFVSENPDTHLEQWEMLSTDELRLLDGTYTRFLAPTLPAVNFTEVPDDDYTPVEGKAIAYRLWNRHPRFSALADCSMEGILDLCEELVLLTRAVRARARSRTAGAGVLFIDQKISTVPPDVGPDEDPLEDPFIADLTEAMTSPIVDEGTAAAVVPLVARVEVPDGMRLQDLVYHLQIVDPMQLYPETGLRYECIQRMAIGLDMPPEILLGVMDANHWTAWLIDEQSWKAHLQPIAQELVDDLTSSYLSPYLRENGVDDWQRYRIAYDATAIINHPDRTKDAKDLYAARAISKRALREACGFDEEDAMPKDELAEAIGIAVRDSGLAWDGTPSPRGGVVETSPGVLVSADPPGTPEPPSTGPATGAEVEKGPPPEKDAPGDETVIGSALEVMRTSGLQSPLAVQIAGAAQVVVLRAREAAGSKLLTAFRRDEDVQESLRGIRTSEIPSRLGLNRVRSRGFTEAQLAATAGDLMRDALRMFNVKDETVVESIVSTVEKHAARTMFEANPSPLPASFINYVRGVIATAANGNGNGSHG